MEIKIIWSDIAIAQLEDIFDFHKTIASHSIAQKLVKSIIKKSLILKSTPLLGVKEPLLSNRAFEYRFLIEKNYKIIYRFNDHLVRISTVFDCRQNPSKLKMTED